MKQRQVSRDELVSLKKQMQDRQSTVAVGYSGPGQEEIVVVECESDDVQEDSQLLAEPPSTAKP